MNKSRRNFVKTSSAVVAAPLLAAFHTPPQPKPLSATPAKGYVVKIFATNWGFDGNVQAFCAKAKAAGYDGIEVWWPGGKTQQAELFAAVQQFGLALGLLFGAHDPEPKMHIDHFTKGLAEIVSNTVQKPVYINLHSGRDFFTNADNEKIIRVTEEVKAKSGIPIYHETHRGRMLFAAPITHHFLSKFSGLRLTLDISHWCNVHESMLENQAAAVALALERTDHIHARVGHEEGPQVSDPRAPEWQYALNQHLQWWDTIAAAKRTVGKPLTILTEFGPPNYLPAIPYTKQPVANQWEINVYMMNLLRERYKG